MKKSILNIALKILLIHLILVSCDTQKSVLQISRNIALTDYNKIDLVGSATVRIIKSNSQFIEVSADERIIDYVNIVNDNGAIKIFVEKGKYKEKCSTAKWFNNNNYCEINVYIPINKNLNSIALDGNGDIIFETELKTKSNIKFSLIGNGDIVSKKLIKANNINIKLKYNGDIDLFNIEANAVNTELVGKGDVTLAGKCNDFNVYVDNLGDVHAKNLVFKKKNFVAKNGGLVILK
jgi:hypothetical protein